MEKWQDSHVIAAWITLAVLFIVVLVGFIILFVYLSLRRMIRTRLKEASDRLAYEKGLLETSIVTQERERRRIAADLHDELIGKLLAAQLQNMLPDQQQQLDELLADSIAVARRVSHDLSPPMSGQVPLYDHIREILAPWKQVMAIDFRCDARAAGDLPDQAKIQLMRVAQEWTSNIVKHARATHVSVHYRHTDRLLALLIRDNGKGFDTNVSPGGLGMKNIEMRMHYLGGSYRLRSAAGKGTSALFVLQTPHPSNT